MAAHVSPNFVSLDELSSNTAKLGIPQLLAVLPSRFQKGKNRAFVQPCATADGANAHAFEHQGKSLLHLCRVGIVSANQFGSARIGKGCEAGIAAPALDSAFSISAETLAGRVVTTGTRHGVSPLDFWRKKLLKLVEAWMRASSASELAPQPVSNTARFVFSAKVTRQSSSFL
jgi:hypothetical protein